MNKLVLQDLLIIRAALESHIVACNLEIKAHVEMVLDKVDNLIYAPAQQ